MSNAALSFDTLQYSKKLKEAGFTEQQAEVQAEALRDVIDNNLATKVDILELKKDIKAVEREIKAAEERLTYKLTLRFGSMLVGGVVFLSALVTLLKFL